jgi:hypothetical protein
VTGAQSRSRLGVAPEKAAIGPGVRDLSSACNDRGNVVEIAHEFGVEIRCEDTSRPCRQSGFHRPPLGAPFRATTLEDAHVWRAHRDELPPDARRREQSGFVIDDDRHPVADPERANCRAELLRRQQHVRQSSALVGDVVNVEEHCSPDVAGEVLLTGPAVGGRQVPAGIDDHDVGIIEMLCEPFGGNEG